ncbi:MAG: peptidase S8, partial [Gammaproteobacteria bacterium HGW-Gammaproteobacteria-4]
MKAGRALPRPLTLAAATAVALSTAFAASAADRIDTSALQAGGSYDRFIVKYRDGSAEYSNAASRVQSLSRTAKSRAMSMQSLLRLSVDADVIKASRKLDRAGAEALMRDIAANPNVEYIQLDALMHPLFTPNDTQYASGQWDFFEATGGMNLPLAWDKSTGSGVVVAVIDTGYVDHTDLNANILQGYDFISDASIAADGNGRDSDAHDPGDASGGQNSSWHGTHVAGTVAAVTNNAKGVAGVAFNAKVVPARVLGKGGGFTSDIVDAITWASGGAVSGVPTNANPAEVINMSLGGTGACDSASQNAINGAVGRGTVVVVAAGNDNVNVSNANPANCNNVVAVAATDRNGARASFSNFGAGIDVSAPGVSILSTRNAGTTTPGAENYSLLSGTSMSSPHVAGLAALIMAAAAKTPAEVESILKSTARPLPGACSGGCGAGIVDSLAAVNAALGSTPPPAGGTLTKGVAVTGLAASTGNDIKFTMDVPSGSSNLAFNLSGGTGDADMYVRFGSAPTDTVYDCRPFLSGNTETCSFAAPQTGTYHVRVKAFSSFSGVSLVGNYTAGSTQPSFFENQTDFIINDNSTVDSPITVSGRSGNAPSTLKVDVTIFHTWKGDLKVDVVAPDGTLYNIHN